jgi:cyclic 2,3-diphosphoglycerate synthetase
MALHASATPLRHTGRVPSARASNRPPRFPFLPQEGTIRYLVIVDGEHYPPVVQSALSDLAATGHEVASAVLVGGVEKLPIGGVAAYGGIPVRSGADARDVLHEAITDLVPDAVLDLSDEPVLDYRRRHELVAVALGRGVPYEGTDFTFSPPPRPRLAGRPTLAIIGTGKRTGKTAVSGYAARFLNAHGYQPVVLAMGRGGPAEPEVLRGDEVALEPKDLVALADAGRHAASDYVEDAMLARVPTVGCRRCGGGLSGGVSISNVAAGVDIANALPGDLLMLEGSGSAIPPVHADVTGLVMPASIPEEYLKGYMGPYRMLLADFVLVTMCENPFGSPSQISAITSLVDQAWRPAESRRDPDGEIRIVRTVFRPNPTRSVEGAAVFVATTAVEAAERSITRHLQSEHGCKVVGISHALSDRARLEEELGGIKPGSVDVLLCEIKAAGIDTATRWALDNNVDVTYMDNIPMGVDGDDPDEVFEWAGLLALERHGR